MRIAGFALLAIALVAALPACADPESLSEADREHYRSAFYHAKKNHWHDAVIHASRADDQVLAGVIHWMRLKEDRRSGFHDIRDFLESRPDWPSLNILRENAEAAMPADLDNADVIAYFDAYPPLTDAGVLRRIEALLDGGREDDAGAAIADAWKQHIFDRSAERSFLGDYGDRLNGSQHWERVDRLIWQGDTAAARRILGYLESDDLRRLAEVRSRLRDHEWGVDAALARVPDHLQDDEALLYERIDWRLDKDRPDGAHDLLARIPEALIHPDMWAVQRLRIAGHLVSEGDDAGAYEVAAAHRAFHGAFHHRAEWLAGWIALRWLDEPRTALDHFSHLYYEVSLPISLARAAYWCGRAAEAANAGTLAMDWYARAARHGHTFYGQLAALRAGFDVRYPDAPGASSEAIAEHELGIVAHRLIDVGEKSLAQTFLLRMSDTATSGPQLRAVAEMAIDLGLPHVSVRAARKALRQGVVLVEAGHPVINLPDVQGVDDDLVLAIINRESEFNRRAVSGRAALGLMQIRLETARSVAGRLGIETSKAMLLENVQHNILLGATYLRNLIREKSGSIILALAAYNGGPGNVRKWVDRLGNPDHPDVDAIDWIESIPFHETRNYVQRVIETMQVYRMLRGEQPVEIFSSTGSS